MTTAVSLCGTVWGMNERTVQLRAWASWNDLAYEEHGTDASIAARRKANAIMDELEPLTEADWGIIRLAQRGYLTEAQSA